MNEATVNLFFDERREKKKSKFTGIKREKNEKVYPIKLTIYHPIFDKKRYGTGVDLTPEEWEKINAPKLKDSDLKETKLKLDALVFRADEIIKSLKTFSFEEFETEFLGNNKKQKKDSFFEIFQEYIKQIKSKGQNDLATKYQETIELLQKIRTNLHLNQITQGFLKEFEAFIKEEVLRTNRDKISEAFEKSGMSEEDLKSLFFGKAIGTTKFGIADADVKCEKKRTDLLHAIKPIIASSNLVSRSHIRNINSVLIDLIAKGKLDQGKCPFNILFELFEVYKEDLNGEGRVGTAGLFRYTCNTLKEMKSDLKLLNVNREFLISYESFMRAKKISDSTIGINFRNLRAIINVAIKRGLFPKDQYPFDGFTIPASQNVKKALDDKSLRKVLGYTTKDPDKMEAWDYWVFLYLSNGMNMKDAALLLKEKVDKDFFYFNRAKTIRTRKKDLRPIKVPLHPLAKKIIKRRKSDDSNPYLFPILEPGLSALTIRGRVNRLLKFINKNIKEIFSELNIKLGLDRKPGTMDARHSFATKLRRKGVPDNEIGEYLGHTDPKTTKNYFDSFPDEHLKKRSKLLL